MRFLQTPFTVTVAGTEDMPSSSSATKDPSSLDPRRMVVTVLLGIQTFTPTLIQYSPCPLPDPESGETIIANGEQRVNPYDTGADVVIVLA